MFQEIQTKKRNSNLEKLLIVKQELQGNIMAKKKKKKCCGKVKKNGGKCCSGCPKKG
jgi:hypothetical protein